MADRRRQEELRHRHLQIRWAAYQPEQVDHGSTSQVELVGFRRRESGTEELIVGQSCGETGRPTDLHTDSAAVEHPFGNGKVDIASLAIVAVIPKGAEAHHPNASLLAPAALVFR
jgi:hypothetical protein